MQSFVDYTNTLLARCKRKASPGDVILVFGPEYFIPQFGGKAKTRVVVPDSDKDFCEWMMAYRKGESFVQASFCILSRVLEHVEVKKVDWFLYNLYTLLRKDAEVIITVPDCPRTAADLEKEFQTESPDLFKIYRMTFELFSEGANVWDRHALWCSKAAVKFYLEKEGLFKFKGVKPVQIDTPLVTELEISAHRL